MTRGSFWTCIMARNLVERAIILNWRMGLPGISWKRAGKAILNLVPVRFKFSLAFGLLQELDRTGTVHSSMASAFLHRPKLIDGSNYPFSKSAERPLKNQNIRLGFQTRRYNCRDRCLLRRTVVRLCVVGDTNSGGNSRGVSFEPSRANVIFSFIAMYLFSELEKLL